MKRRFLLLPVLAAVAVSGTADGASVLIDDFANPQGTQTITLAGLGPLAGTLNIADGSAIGGARRLSANKLSATGGQLQVGSNPFFQERFYYAASPQTTGTALLGYDSGTVGALNPNGLGGIDLWGGGLQQGVAFDLQASDSPDGFFTVTIYDNDSALTAVGTIAVPQIVSPQQLALPWSSFVVSDGITPIEDVVDSVGAIEILVDGTNAPSWDTEFGFVGTLVPEPSRALLGLMGLVGAVGFSRRRPRV